MTVSAYPLGDSLAPQDLMFNLLDHLYSTEGVFHDGDLAVTADTDGIGVKIAPGAAILRYESAFGGKRAFFNSAENRSINSEFLNPSFDTDTVGWFGYNGATLTRDTGVFHSSPASCRVQTTGPTTNNQGIQWGGGVTMKVDPNRLQELSCWVRANVGTSVTLSVTEHNAALTQITGHEDTQPGTGDWVKLKVNFTTTANTRFVWCQVLITAGSAQTYYVDDFEATRSFDWIAGFKPAHPSLPRVDRVVIQIQDSAIAGGGDTSIGAKFRVVPGTPTSGATLVNLTGAAAIPNNSYLLANVLVPAGATALTTGNIDTAVRLKPDLTVPSSVLSDVAALDTRVDALEAGQAAFPLEAFYTEAPNKAVVTTLANFGTLTRMTVERRMTVSAVRFVIGNSAGNIDVAIFKFDDPNNEYDRVWSRGSFACPAAGPASINISAGSPTSLILDPGVYYLAVAGNNAGFTYLGQNADTLLGVSWDTNSSSFPFPASIAESGLSQANRAINGFLQGA